VFYDWQHLLPNISLLQSWIPYDEYFFVANGSSWFLCDIVFFYLVFCWAYRLLNRMRISYLLLLGIVVLVFYGLLAFSIPIWTVNSILYVSPATRLIDFCIGILLFRLFRSDAGSRLEHWMEGKGYLTITLWEFLFVALLVVSFFIYESMSLRLRCAALFWLFLPLLLLFFSVSDKHGGWLTRLLHHPVLLWFGSISLEIYLVHMLVLRIVYGVMRSAGFDNALLLIVTELSVLFPVAWLTKRFFVDKVYFFLNKFVP
jgi:peptidoglycan/LPS O-acetylase OafA/YrhL